MQGQNLTLKPFLLSHRLRRLTQIFVTQEHLWISVVSAGEQLYAAWEVFAHRLHRLTQIFVTQEHLWISVVSAGEQLYAAWEVFAHRLHRLTQIFVTQEHLWISVESTGEHSYAAWKVISHRLRGSTQILVFSRTSVNICEICRRTFICCLKDNIPQITRINTDFSFLKNICEYLWDL